MKKKMLTYLCAFSMIVLLNSCSSTDTYDPIDYENTDEYRYFIEESLGFTFEYPADLSLIEYLPHLDSSGVAIRFSGSVEEEAKGNIHYLQINLTKEFTNKETASNCRISGASPEYKLYADSTGRTYNEITKNAKAAMELRIEDYRVIESRGEIENLKILATRKVKLGNEITGWEMTLSFNELPITDNHLDIPFRENVVSVIARYLYFWYQDMIWEVFLYGSAETDTRNIESFEHVLRTLRCSNETVY